MDVCGFGVCSSFDFNYIKLIALPHKIGETSRQMHCGRAAAEHGENALQVEQLQKLVITGDKTQMQIRHAQPVIEEG